MSQSKPLNNRNVLTVKVRVALLAVSDVVVDVIEPS